MSITQNGPSSGPGSLPQNGSSSSEASSMNINTFKPLLSKLLQKPQDFTPEDMRQALIHVVTGAASHAQMGSFLASLRVSDVWRKPDMVQTQVQVFSELSGNIKVGGEGHICDWTLTGESRLSVLNVALPAAILAAGAGCRVVKTGNASSPWPSTPSSGDILTALSVPTNTLPLFSLIKVASSRHVPFLHIYTPRYAPRFAAIAPNPLRRELGFETIFHSLSSLVSPAKRDYCVIGVHEERLGAVFAEGMKTLGAKRAWIVHGKNGLDAISLEGETTVWDLKDGQVITRTITPALFGVQERPLASIQLPSNGDAAESPAAQYRVHAKIIASILSPRRNKNNEPIEIPYREGACGSTRTLDTQALEDWVCMNAAALLLICGKAQDEKAAFALATKTLKEGKAYHALEALRDAAALAVDVDAAETPQGDD